MKYKCLLVDDEPLAIQLLESHLAMFDDFEVVQCCHNVPQAYQALHKHKIDLLFLDIQMPKISGIEMLRSIKSPPPTILTTAYRHYALESYEFGVVDYLLKPITLERFIKAIDRFLDWQKMGSQQHSNQTIQEETITIRASGKNIKIDTSNIILIESKREYINIVTTNGEYLTKIKISKMEDMLEQQRFARVHRSFIINLDKVTAFKTTVLELGDWKVPIGNTYINLLKTLLPKSSL